MPHPLPVIDHVYRCAFHWTADLQSATNVVHVSTDTVGKTPLEVFTCLDAHVTAGMWGNATTDSAVVDVAITPLDGTTATADFPTGGVAKWSGVNGGEFVPQVAIIVKLATPTRGRSHRGRLFLPFTSEGSIARGSFDGAIAASMTTAWNAFALAIDTDATTPMNLVVASYKLASASAVDNIIVERVPGTQRRRQGRLRT